MFSLNHRGLIRSTAALAPAVSASVTFPGDIVTGASTYWGGEAYNAAYATGSNPAYDLVDTATGLIATTVNILSNGRVDTATISGLGVGQSVTKAYDQTGNGNHLVQTTLALMPTIEISGANSWMVFASGQFLAKTSWNGNNTLAQPYTASIFFMDTGSVSTGGSLTIGADNGSGSAILGMFSNDGAANKIEIYAGSGGVNVTASNNTWHSLSAVASGGASDMNVNGTANTGSAGTTGLIPQRVLLSSPTLPIIGKMARAGIWPSAFSAGNSTSMSSNDHTFWGV